MKQIVLSCYCGKESIIQSEPHHCKGCSRVYSSFSYHKGRTMGKQIGSVFFKAFSKAFAANAMLAYVYGLIKPMQAGEFRLYAVVSSVAVALVMAGWRGVNFNPEKSE